MTSLSKFLSQNDFAVAAKIVNVETESKSKLIFEIEPEFRARGIHGAKCGWVYVWVGTTDRIPETVLYVGKAGQTQTFRDRCGQHRNGFSSSTTGRKNAERINKFMKIGSHYKISVYARHSEMGEAFGINNISMCEFEERALIQKFKDDGHCLWNFEKKQKSS